MSTDFIDSRIDACHEMIENGDFQGVPGILKLIGEIRIHDKNVKEEITKFEKDHDERLEKNLVEIEHSNENALVKQHKTSKEYYLYAISYLRFYDKLRKQYELF